jgi:CHAT domain
MSHQQDAPLAADNATQGLDLLRAYQRTGQLPLLLAAVQRLREAASATPADNLSLARRLSNLGLALLSLFERTGDTSTLAESVEAGRLAVAATPPGHPRLAGRLNNLGNALLTLFERTGNIDALAEAVQTGRLAAASAGGSDHAVIASNLGNSLRLWSTVADDPAVLHEAVEAGREAVATAPADHPDRAAFLNNLGLALRLLSERTEDPGLAVQAVQAAREAVAADHPDRAAFLNNLGLALQGVFQRTRDMSALAEAIQAGRAAVAATPTGHPHLAERNSSLGHALLTQYEQAGDAATLAEAVQATRDASAGTPPGHPKAADRLNALATALQMLSLRSRDTALMAEAIQASRDAAAAVSPDSPDHAAVVGNLANGLSALFELSGDTAVLREAAALARRAARPAGGTVDRALNSGNLASVLLRLHVRAGDADTLAEALAAAREAVAATVAGRADRAALLDLLSLALRMTAEETDDAAALIEAIRVGREAVAAIPAGQAGRASALNNLGISLLMQFWRSGDTVLLSEAVETGREAVAATPADDPSLGLRLNSLGTTLQAAAEQTGSREAMREALSVLSKAGGLELAPVWVRITALADAAVIAERLDVDPAVALELVEEAVRLLPQLAPRALARADREHQLGSISPLGGAGSLAGVAAAAALAAGRPARAVELLEQARGVLVADTVNARSSDLSRLWETAPSLAAAFADIRTKIEALDRPGVVQPGADAAASGSADKAGGEFLTLGRQDTQAAWEALLARIREQDGFNDFLLPPRVESLVAQAHDGPIVFLTTSPTRSYALIVTDHPSDPVRALPLTSLSADDITARLDNLAAAREIALEPPDGNPIRRLVGQVTIFNTLRWIWDTITGPVLDTLGYTSTPGNGASWPRVWWCPTGFLTQLPLHAAGHHIELTGDASPTPANPPANRRTVMDRVVSSYITTLRGLGYARAHHPAPGADPALIIAVPDAPGAAPLPGADAEANFLAKLIPGARRLPHPSRDTVLQALPGYRVAHFACHAVSDSTDPAASRLILDDYLVSPLTVADISACRLDVGLAFLSACATATSGPTLADEYLHLTGAFHLAGYRHVIGALWPVNDQIARRLARDFYAHLTARGTTPPDVDAAALALHQATRRLRDKYLTSPAHWAAYMHTGA